MVRISKRTDTSPRRATRSKKAACPVERTPPALRLAMARTTSGFTSGPLGAPACAMVRPGSGWSQRSRLSGRGRALVVHGPIGRCARPGGLSPALPAVLAGLPQEAPEWGSAVGGGRRVFPPRRDRAITTKALVEGLRLLRPDAEGAQLKAVDRDGGHRSAAIVV